MKKGTIDIITLGCSKNLVDAERLMRQLELRGWSCVHDSPNPQGEMAVINTCGFIGDAKEESINTILEFVERKRKRKLRALYVMGCLSERYLADLEAEIPEVDGWFGKFDFLSIVEKISGKGYVVRDKERSEAEREKEVCEGSKTSGTNNTSSSSGTSTTSSTSGSSGSSGTSSTIGSSGTSDTSDSSISNGSAGCAAYERVITTPGHYAYLKISEGCDRFCSYCAIPYITGRHTPRPMEEILDEVRWLVSKGVKELNVIAQDLSAYPHLADLVEAIAQVPGVEWIRLHYAYPTDFPYDLLPVMARYPNVCKYLDIALQHSSNHMLEMMRRHITCEEQSELIERIRREVPGICIRTTLIAGHPGETEEDFEEMKQWIRQMRFDRMGCFAYSHEEGTYSYKHYEDDVPDEVKQRRVDEIMAIQQEISAEVQAARFPAGKIERVVIDRQEGEYYIGRTQYDSPEVDCEVLVTPIPPNKSGTLSPKGAREIRTGEFYNVKITRTTEFDIYAEIC